MAVNFFKQDCNFELPHKRITKKWISRIIARYGFKLGTLNYIFCSDAEILKINMQYLNHDYFTDIITFPYSEESTLSADIFISIDTVRFNAENFNQKFEDELNRVIIHGVLHLIGFRDNTKVEKEKMREEENKSVLIFKELFNKDAK